MWKRASGPVVQTLRSFKRPVSGVSAGYRKTPAEFENNTDKHLLFETHHTNPQTRVFKFGTDPPCLWITRKYTTNDIRDDTLIRVSEIAKIGSETGKDVLNSIMIKFRAGSHFTYEKLRMSKNDDARACLNAIANLWVLQ